MEVTGSKNRKLVAIRQWFLTYKWEQKLYVSLFKFHMNVKLKKHDLMNIDNAIEICLLLCNTDNGTLLQSSKLCQKNTFQFTLVCYYKGLIVLWRFHNQRICVYMCVLCNISAKWFLLKCGAGSCICLCTNNNCYVYFLIIEHLFIMLYHNICLHHITMFNLHNLSRYINSLSLTFSLHLDKLDIINNGL